MGRTERAAGVVGGRARPTAETTGTTGTTGITGITGTTGRLDRLRGNAPYRPHTARTLAALTGNPGCARRAVLDAAGVDKNATARHIGFPARFGRSKFAITREAGFERLVKADHCAELVRVLRERLGFGIPEASYADLGRTDGTEDLAARYERTRRLLAELASGGDTGSFLDHPVLRLDLAGSPVYLEPEVIALRLGGRFHIVEIKSFAVIDGQADSAKVTATARQSAVHLIALRRLLAAFDVPPEKVSHDIVLVCPENFSNRPTASLVDVRQQVLIVEHQLARMARVDTLLDGLPPDLTFDLGQGRDGVATRPATEVAAALDQVPARYAPDCLSACELAYFCRHRAREDGRIGRLGKALGDAVGGVETVADALTLADPSDPSVRPAPAQAETAARLRLAARLYGEVAGSVGSGQAGAGLREIGVA